MPAASISQRQNNLARLSNALSAHCPQPDDKKIAANSWALTMPLSHATAFGNLQNILRSGALLSQIQMAQAPGNDEAMLDTADDVFLYAGAFSYPNTECGFLFLPAIEEKHIADGVATPFDSGAYASRFRPPAPYEDGVTFVREHELPVSDYRAMLGRLILEYASTPEQYLNSPTNFVCSFCGVARLHPLGLEGNDHRAATFEVRIPQRVLLHPPHLRAVFVQEGFELPELSSLFAVGVTIETYSVPDDGNFFNAMRLSCINFISQHLIS